MRAVNTTRSEIGRSPPPCGRGFGGGSNGAAISHNPSGNRIANTTSTVDDHAASSTPIQWRHPLNGPALMSTSGSPRSCGHSRGSRPSNTPCAGDRRPRVIGHAEEAPGHAVGEIGSTPRGAVTAETLPARQVLARYDAETITVYQAYPAHRGHRAQAGTFVPPFKVERMTWIKPSFLWMMCCGWARKAGQKRAVTGSSGRSRRAASATTNLAFTRANRRGAPNRQRVRCARSRIRNATCGLRPCRTARSRADCRGGHAALPDRVDPRPDRRDRPGAPRPRTGLGRAARRRPRRMPHERPYPLSEPIAVRLGAMPETTSATHLDSAARGSAGAADTGRHDPQPGSRAAGRALPRHGRSGWTGSSALKTYGCAVPSTSVAG